MKSEVYLEKFKICFDEYDSIKKYINDELLNEFIESKKAWFKILQNPEFPVVFIGQFSAGKSVVINALINEYILPENTKSTTAVPTIIKRSNNGKDYIKINYLNLEEKNQLKDLYLESIISSFPKPISSQINLNDLKLLDVHKVVSEIEKYINKDENNTFTGKTLFDELKKLISKWNDKTGKYEEDKIEKISSYVVEDENSDIILINNVEVYLKSLDIPEKMIIVDLPGVGVINPRHKKITEDYVKDKAKAFVSVGKVNNLIQGEEKILYDNISNIRKDAFKKSFWLLNQWDNLTENQREQETTNFYKLTENYLINKNNVFKVSALSYLIIQQLKKGNNLSKDLEKHIDVLTKKIPDIKNLSLKEIDIKINTIDYLKNFKDFKESLFKYLNTKCEEDFLYEVQTELEDTINKIKNKIPQDKIDSNIEDLKLQKLSLLIEKIKLDYKEQLETTTNKFFLERKNSSLKYFEKNQVLNEFEKETKNQVPNEFEKKIKNQALNEFKKEIENLDIDEIKEEMTQGKFISGDGISIKLPNHLYDKVKVGHILEKVVVNFVKEIFVAPMEEIKNRLSNNSLKYLSENIYNFINKQIIRDTEMRAKGISDILLLEYSKEINQSLLDITNNLEKKSTSDNLPSNSKENDNNKKGTTFSFQNSKENHNNNNLEEKTENHNNLEKKIKIAIDIFSKGIKKFIEDKWFPQSEKYLEFMIKNQYNDLKEELISKLKDDNDNDLNKHILEKAKKSLDSELESEINKISAFKKANKEMEKISSNLR